MATRCKVIIRDEHQDMMFFRDSKGSPPEVKESLTTLLQWLKEGKIKNDIPHFSGWLILIGAIEDNSVPSYKIDGDGFGLNSNLASLKAPVHWKCGTYHVGNGHDEETDFSYVFDLINRKIEVGKISKGKEKVVEVWG